MFKTRPHNRYRDAGARHQSLEAPEILIKILQ